MHLFKTISFLFLFLLLLTSSCGYQTTDRSFSQEEKNLVAFSKMYGFVKYFHPSDEARQMDWNKLAVLGVEAVKKAKNNTELKSALDSVFLPIAPTITISETRPDSGLFLSEYTESIGQDTTSLKTVTWQHLGVNTEQSSRYYASSRINRQDKAWNKNVTLFQSLDAQKLRGETIRLLAMITTKVEGSGNEGELFRRVNDDRSCPIAIESTTTGSPTASAGRNEYKIESDIGTK